MNSNLLLSLRPCILIWLFMSLATQAQAQDNKKGNQPDSIPTTLLKEVSVKARRNLYKTRPDVIIYDVKADSSLIGKNSFEALRNVPLLNVERNGNIHSVGNWPIEYTVNGSYDRTVSGNIHDALESLEAKYLKRIEVRIVRNINGQQTLQINLVTKGRLWGYRGLGSSSLSDSNWRNGAFAFAKKNKFGATFSYYNNWRWGHDSRLNSEEWRYASNDLYHAKSEYKSSGFKVDLHNFETTLSYEITPLKVVSVYARTFLKTNPHNTSTNEYVAENNAGQQTYRYKQDGLFKMNDSEYQVCLDYEQLFGENAERGKFYAGYEFYSRPNKEQNNNYYTLLEYINPSYVKDFFNYNKETSDNEDWHTLTVMYRRKFKQHTLYAEDFMRLRIEKEDITQQESYAYTDNPYETIERDQYRHNQFSNGLKIGYSYTTDKIEAKAGAFHQFLRDTSKKPLLNNSFSANQQFVTPYADFSYVPNWRVRFNLSYSMGKQVPNINSLNPYVDTTVPGEIFYGNPNLKPQTTQDISLSSNFRIGKFNFNASSTHSFGKDIILRHSFLKDNILNKTFNNVGKRHENLTKIGTSSKITPTTWMRLDASLYYTDYAATEYYNRNKGFTFSTTAYMEQELPHNFDINFGAGYNSPYIYMQGKGDKNFYYNLSVYKSFPKQRITVSAEANSFLPIYYKNSTTSSSENYYEITHHRSFHASFQLSVRWRFGKLKADEYSVDERYDHKDVKTNYDE